LRHDASLAWIVGVVLPALLGAQTGRGPYATHRDLAPHDGHTVEFEAGYLRHLAWHKQAGDTWVWYGWGIWAGGAPALVRVCDLRALGRQPGQRGGPADDERDNVLNVAPHVEYIGNAVYEYLPGLSRGTGEPQPTARLEFTTVDLVPGSAKAFEAALERGAISTPGETLWYRMVAGGAAPRYVRLRPRPSLFGGARRTE